MVGVREFKLEIVKHQLMVQAPYIRVFISLADWFLTPHSKIYHLYTCTTIVRKPLSHLLSTALQIFVEVKMIFAIFFIPSLFLTNHSAFQRSPRSREIIQGAHLREWLKLDLLLETTTGQILSVNSQ